MPSFQPYPNNPVGVLSGIVDLSRFGQTDLGDVRLGTNFTRDLLKAGQASLNTVANGIDYEDVLKHVISIIPDGDVDLPVWNVLEPFMELLPFEGLQESLQGLAGEMGLELYSIFKERAFMGTVMSLDNTYFDQLFGEVLSVVAELEKIITIEQKMMDISESDFKGILSNVVPVDKLEGLGVMREFVPFLFEQVASMNEKMTSVKDRLLERAGLDVTKKQALGLLEYALKVAPTKFKENICLKDTCSENVAEGLEDVIELHPLVAGILSERVNFMDVIKRPMTLAGAEEFLSSVLSTAPKEIITELTGILGSLDVLTTVGLFTAGASQEIEHMGGKLDSLRKDPFKLDVVAANLFGNDVFNKDSLKLLVTGSQIVNIPELGSFISLKDGFLVDTFNSIIATKIKSGELFKEFSFQLADGSTSGDFIKKLTEEKGAINIVAMDTFPGQLEMFKGIIVELSKVQGMFEIFSEKFRLDERFTIQDFAHMLESLTARFSSLGSPP